MKITKNLGMILLAIWLILSGLISLFGLSFNGSQIVLAILAIAAGVVILSNRFNGKFTGNIGRTLLGVWLVLQGLITLFNFSFNGLDLLIGVLALAAGVLLLLGR